MITPSFGLTATERVLPKLALDFTTASLDSRVTFTRSGSTATRTNSSGYIESVAADTPRFDYDPVTLTCKGLLIEEARTNVLTYSTDISNAAWTKAGNASVAASTEVSPDGTTDAYKLIGGDGGTAYLYRAAGYVTTATAHTVSVYMKRGTVNTVNLFFVTAGSTQGAKCAFDSRGSVGTITNYGSVTGTTATITSVGNGWYRCTMTLTTTADTYYVQITTVGAVYTNLYGFQVEVGAFATSYIPTTTAALTRNGDNANISGANFSDWYNQSEGTFTSTQSLIGASGNQSAFSVQGTSYNNNSFHCMASYNSTRRPRILGYSGATSVLDLYMTGAVPLGNQYTVGFAYKTDDCAAAKNGETVVVDTTAAIYTSMSDVYLGFGQNQLNGHIQKFNYWPQRLLNNEVQAFSKG